MLNKDKLKIENTLKKIRAIVENQYLEQTSMKNPKNWGFRQDKKDFRSCGEAEGIPKVVLDCASDAAIKNCGNI